MLTRRSFLQGSSLLFVSACAPRLRHGADTSRTIAGFSPIDRNPAFTTKQLTGDDFTIPHRLLWDKSSFLAGRKPVSTERVPLVVIGGGVSGLLSAYYLRDHHPVVLEQASRFGGNAKGEEWLNIPYSLGAAYFTAPDSGSPHAALYQELGLHREWSVKKEEDPTEYRGHINWNFWETSSNRHDQTLRTYLLDVFNERGYQFPDIPVIDPSHRDEINRLDRLSFFDHLVQQAQGPLSQPAMTALEQYCWSSFGGSAHELSAASGVNFYAGEFGDVMVLPGGNSRFAERLLEELASSIPRSNLRPRSLVIDVAVADEGVKIWYVDESENLREISAQAVICACPKFVVKKLSDSWEPSRLAAIQRLSYRAYMVANVLLKAQAPRRFYDLYLLGKGHSGASNTQEQSTTAGVTDVILANYAHHEDGRCVLTLYQALPYEGGRPWLYAQGIDPLYQHFEHQAVERVLPTLGIPSSAIEHLRVTRWGHPLPLAATNLIADGVVDTLRAPFRERIFFIEQDNWALPALETCVSEAAAITPQVRVMLQRR